MNNSSIVIVDYNEYAQLPYIKALFSTILALTSFLIILGNIFSLIVLYRVRSISEPTRISMISLTIANLCSGLFRSSPGVFAAAMGRWPFRGQLCAVQGVLNHALLTACIWNLLVLCLDRFIAILKPLRYHQIVTAKKALLAVLISWCLAVIGGFTMGPLQTRRPAHYMPEYCSCYYQFQFNPWFYVSFATFVTVPYIVMFFLFTYMFVIARRHAKRIQNGIPNNPEAQVKQPPARKSAITYALVMLFFDISITPMLLLHTYNLIIRTRCYGHFVVTFVFTVLFHSFSFLCLPVFYKRTAAFREELYRIAAKICPFKCCKV
ncbi:beta-3 adrenergic receptor-like [Patiria miniata]|uniref:G-protein coupled receptors family 1 profile domain-containing protein n=1 Tax=Patiria miniata TaxID=46514 RepID=A0A913ZM02_PATMI|nr:beta-3 adrenergic receptor-like [Patiria miniata]